MTGEISSTGQSSHSTVSTANSGSKMLSEAECVQKLVISAIPNDLAQKFCSINPTEAGTKCVQQQRMNATPTEQCLSSCQYVTM